MDKKLILAVAGSGKTKFIIEKLCLKKRSLIITYTENNIRNLTDRVRKKFGYVPENIKIFSYFTFLYSFCYRPLLDYKYNAKGIDWNPCQNRFAKNNARFINYHGQLYSNRIAKLLQEECLTEVKERISKYFENVFIDEVQDFAGNDFNFLIALYTTKSNIYCVGDFYQHTFDTSTDNNAGGKIYDDYSRYKDKFNKKYIVDEKTLLKSHRCSPTVCKFVSEKLGINIESARNDETQIEFVDCPVQVQDIIRDNLIIKLFYQDSKNQECKAENWGKSKGLDCFNHVCIILNKTTLDYWNTNKNFVNLNPKTKNKLYVACTRAKGNLYFIGHDAYKKIKKQCPP